MCIGGTDFKADVKNIKDCPNVIVATPGKLNLMLTKKILDLKYLKLLVVDEADEMLSRGFKDQIKQLMQYVPG